MSCENHVKTMQDRVMRKSSKIMSKSVQNHVMRKSCQKPCKTVSCENQAKSCQKSVQNQVNVKIKQNNVKTMQIRAKQANPPNHARTTSISERLRRGAHWAGGGKNRLGPWEILSQGEALTGLEVERSVLEMIRLRASNFSFFRRGGHWAGGGKIVSGNFLF